MLPSHQGLCLKGMQGDQKCRLHSVKIRKYLFDKNVQFKQYVNFSVFGKPKCPLFKTEAMSMYWIAADIWHILYARSYLQARPRLLTDFNIWWLVNFWHLRQGTKIIWHLHKVIINRCLLLLSIEYVNDNVSLYSYSS